MRISTITNGISQDYETCCKVMRETNVKYAEIQEVFGKRVEYISPEEAQTIRALNDQYGISVSCITTHAFVGIPVGTIEIGDDRYEQQMALLKNGIATARMVGANHVRCMCFAKQSVLDGYNGADQWVAGGNKAWPKFIELYGPIAKVAEEEGVSLIVENGFNGMLTSAYSCRRFMRDICSKNVSILWDPANALNVSDIIYPDAYELIKEYVSHIHIKDVLVNIPESWVQVTPIGRGMMASYLLRLAQALRKDGYEGFVSLENIYRPDGGDYMDGYRIDIPTLIEIFGD